MSASLEILVVDDDEDIRDALRDCLEDEGFSVALAADALEALHYLATTTPQLILLDWNMAPMNGAAFMAEWEKRPNAAGVPVVIVTADARVEEKASMSAFSGLLKKPIDLEELFKVVGRFAARATPTRS